jgi:hypothetical protein
MRVLPPADRSTGSDEPVEQSAGRIRVRWLYLSGAALAGARR